MELLYSLMMSPFTIATLRNTYKNNESSEINYATGEKEALSIVEFIKKYLALIYNSRVFVWTDIKGLQWLFEKASDKNTRITRWILFTQEYNVEVCYFKGEKNVVTDRLTCIQFNTNNTVDVETNFGVKPATICFLEPTNSSVGLVGNFKVTCAEKTEDPKELGWTSEELY